MGNLKVGNNVRTIKNDNKQSTATAGGKANQKKWGVIGEIVAVSGTSYSVMHEDGTTASYEADELMRVLM